MFDHLGITWCSDGHFNRPSAFQPASDRSDINAASPRPLTQMKRLPIRREADSVPSIRHLLRCSGPAAIARLIVLFIVHPIKTVCFGRWLAHVAEECPKAFAPALADRNATTSVSLIVRGFGISAPLNHAIPGSVGLRPIISAAVSMFGIGCRAKLRQCATTGLGVSGCKTVAGPHQFCTASAFAKPLHGAVFVSPGHRYDPQEPEGYISQISIFCHHFRRPFSRNERIAQNENTAKALGSAA